MRSLLLRSGLLVLAVGVTCLTLFAEADPKSKPTATVEAGAADADIDFNRDIRPILSNNCFFCHGPDEKHREADLRLDTKAGAFASAIVPGKLNESALIERIISTDDDI
ncbi:MAG: c-type cytochrome domain-containing protein, partial [Gimesia chilikensis]